jgi:glutamate racemase
MNAPIGIFDSGLGGLTVLREIERALPAEDLIYVGDTARVPYGVKSPETVTRYSREICDFLLQQGVKAIVVACNTSSALALEALRPNYSLPLLGVLEPGAQAAAAATRSQAIGVIGTEGTIRSGGYAKVVSRACPLFVPLVEEGWAHHEVTRQIAEIYLGEWRDKDIDTLILGCTHYPVLKALIQEVLPGVILVDSAQATAKALQELLAGQGLFADSGRRGTQRCFTTDAPQKLTELAARFLGHELGRVELTNLGAE